MFKYRFLSIGVIGEAPESLLQQGVAGHWRYRFSANPLPFQRVRRYRFSVKIVDMRYRFSVKWMPWARAFQRKKHKVFERDTCYR